MPFECPICGTAAETLLPIVNAGKGYKECCNRCESLATLIVQNYPYGQAWFQRPIPVPSLMTGDAFRLPLKEATLPKDEGLAGLKEL